MKQSYDARVAVRILKLEGYSQSQVAKKLSKSLRFVKNWWNAPTAERKPGSGRPSKIKWSVLRRLHARLSRQPRTSARKLAPFLQLSRTSTRRAIRKLGLTPYQPRSVVEMQERHKKERVLLARRHKHDNWSKTIFLDETDLVVADKRNRQNDRYYARSRGDVPPTPKNPHPIKIHAAAGITSSGASRLYLFSENMDAQLYKHILSSTILPDARKLLGNDFQLVQDNDPKHTSKLVTSFLAQKGVQVLKWPAKSPDLNPIENMWSVLESKIMENPPTSRADLEKKARKALREIPASMLKKTVESLPRQLQAVIDQGGGPTGY